MSALRAFPARIRGLFRRSARDRDMADEFAAHLAMETAENVRRGMTTIEARRLAMLNSGGIEWAKEAYRDRRGLPWLDAVARDLRLAVRSLRRNRTFTLSVVLTLALAIGVTTAVTSAVETVVLEPLPGVDLHRVMAIESNNLPNHVTHLGLDPWEVVQLERRHDLFGAIAGYRTVDANLAAGPIAEHVSVANTTGQFFDVLRTKPYLGRLYDTLDVARGADHVVVLGFDLWRSLTGGNRAAVGSTLTLDDSTFTVIGVLPPGFRFPLDAQIWTPHPLTPLIALARNPTRPQSGMLLPAIARVAPGINLPTLAAELAIARGDWSQRFPRFYASFSHSTLTLRSVADLMAGELHPIVLVLVGAVALVLLTACTNVASLYLVRSSGRARELAVRSALGASRGALFRHQAAESGAIAWAGGTLGVALGYGLVALAHGTSVLSLAELHGLRIDGFVLVCTAGVTVATAVGFGMVPALRAMRVAPGAVLAAGGGRAHSMGGARGRFLRTMVVAQVSTALALALGAGIAVRSLRNLLRVNPGFRTTGLVTARLVLPLSRYPLRTTDDVERRFTWHQELLQRLQLLPGVTAATMVDVVPFGFANAVAASTHRMALAAGVGPLHATGIVPGNIWAVDPSYFHTMGIPIVAGEDFSAASEQSDVRSYQTSPMSVVIDEALAKRLFPGESAVGRLIGPTAPGFRVVGVVAPIRGTDLAHGVDADGTVYTGTVAFRNSFAIVLRTALPLERASALLHETLTGIDPRLSVFDVATLGAVIDRTVQPRWLASEIMALFGFLSVALALLGVYGVLRYVVVQRTKEIGVRMAIGATPGRITAMVARAGAGLIVLGLAIGLAVFVAAGQLLASVAYGMSVRDTPTLVVGTCGMLVVGLAAALLPALRAARIDPVKALAAD
ncbi:MAG: ADOP family duplicated permease [Gemmatimonadaceae bacterium]